MSSSSSNNIKSLYGTVDSALPLEQNALFSMIAENLNVSPRKCTEHESVVGGISKGIGDLTNPVQPPVESKPSASSNPGGPVTFPLTPPVTPKAQVIRSVEKNIATLVFFDLETTGLAHQIGKHNVQITELSMIAMNRKEFQNSTNNDLKDIRIMHKLCLCFRPRAKVSPGAAKITGLDNSNLAGEQPFNENAASLIISFLSHLPKPVCLLAHNGISYDYPILKAEFKRNLIELPSDILIADTLLAIRDLGVPVFPDSKKVCKSVKFKNGQVSYGLENLHLYFFNKKPMGSHSSEGDCIALAKVCHLMKDSILPWFDDNCKVMDAIVPLW